MRLYNMKAGMNPRRVRIFLAEKGVTSPGALARRRDAFDRAARATPHGRPILLENDPLAER